MRRSWLWTALLITLITLSLVPGGAQAVALATPPQPFDPIEGGTLETLAVLGGDVDILTVSGDRAYVGMGETIAVFDIAQPASPQLLAELDVGDSVQRWEMEVVHPYLYFLTPQELRVMDVSDLADVSVVARYAVTNTATDFAVAGDYVYLMEYDYTYDDAIPNVLHVLDLSNLPHPVEVGRYESTTLSREFAASGSRVYLTDYDNIIALDVSDPANPVELGTKPWGWGKGTVVAEGTTVYVVDQNGLSIVDWSDLAAPQTIGSVALEDITGLALDGAYGYLTSYDSNLYNYGRGQISVVDLSDPANASVVVSSTTAGPARSVDAQGGTAYVAAGHGLELFSFAGGQVAPTAFHPTLGDVWEVKLTGDLAVVAARRAGVWTVDISNPTQPHVVGHAATPTYALDVALDGELAYVADSGSGMRILDISNPSAPVEVGIYEGGAVESVAASGSYAYAQTIIPEQELHVIDVSDPTQPQFEGKYALSGEGGWRTGVAVAGNYVYLADWTSTLKILDVSDPANPYLAGSLATGTLENLTLHGDRAYLATRGGLAIADISDPTAPVKMGYVGVGEGVGVDVFGNTAYLAGGSEGGLYSIDISDPTAPTVTGESTTRGWGWDVAVNEAGYAYVAARPGGLRVLRSIYHDTATARLPDGSGTLTSDAGDAHFEFPTGAFTGTVHAGYGRLWDTPHTGDLTGAGYAFDLAGVYSSTGEAAALAPGARVTATLTYTATAVREGSLALYRWDDIAGSWTREGVTTTVDAEADAVVAQLDGVGRFALLGESYRVYLPLTLRK